MPSIRGKKKVHRRATSRAHEAREPLVLAVDIGSTATRGGVFDAAGNPVPRRRHRVAHQFTTGGDGTSVVDADAMVAEVSEILDVLAGSAWSGPPVAGVALDTFSSSLVGVTADLRAATPCYTYADSRCAAQVSALREELDEIAVQQRTGCRLHASYLAPRLRWLRDTEPRTFAGARTWLSLGEYVYLRLLGTTAAGTSTAAWSGLLDRHTGRWDPELVAAAGIEMDQLSEIRAPDSPMAEVTPTNRRWKALAEAVWFPVISDGFASNLGVGASDETTMAATLATSGAMRVLVNADPRAIPSGLWCYRVGRAQWLLGGAVNDVGRANSWLRSTLDLPGSAAPDDVLAAPPQPHTPVVLPFLTGERSTGWVSDARAVLSGVSVATSASSLYRGTMEGVAVSYARIAEQLIQVAPTATRVVASGRVAREVPGLLQLLADVLGIPVEPVLVKRSTLRGTAVLALQSVAPDVRREPPTGARTRRPQPNDADYYVRLRSRFASLYDSTVASSG